MAADLATLGIAVDSSPAVRAAADLDRLVSSAGRAQQAAGGIGQGFDASAAAMTRASAAAGQATASLMRATQAANENARAVGLTRNEFVNLGYQFSDIASQISTGTSALTIFVQQGGQVIPVLAQAGSRLSGVFGQIVEGATTAAARVGLVGGAVGAVAGTVIGGALAWRQYAAGQEEAQRSLLGIGAASGASIAGINRISSALADAQTMSVGASRSIVSALAGTGRIDSSVLGGVGGLTRGTAALFGESNADAASRLGDLFASPTRGAEIFNQKLGILTASQKEFIENLEKSGQRTAAQEALINAVQPALQRYTDQTGLLSKGWQAVTAAIGTAVDAAGHFIDRQVTGGTVQERLATATQKYFNAQRNGQPAGSGDAEYEAILRSQGLSETQIQSLVRPSAPGAPPRTNIATATDQLEDLNEQSRRQSQLGYTSARTVAQVQASGEVDTLVKALNPGQEKLKEIQRQAENIRTKLSLLPIDEQGDARRTMEALNTQASLIASNLARGGQEFAASLRSAQYEASNVGKVGVGLTSAQIKQQFAERARAVFEQNKDDPNARDAAFKTLAEERATRLATAQRQATITETQRSGLLATVPPQYRQMFVDAAAQTGLPLEVGIAIARQENAGFNPNIVNRGKNGESHATGIFQLQPGTARGEGVTDITDPQQNILGGFSYAKKAYDKAGGDIADTYRLYHDGLYSDKLASDEARKGAANVQRIIGTPTTSAQVLEGDTRERDLQLQQRQQQISAEQYGKNGLLFDAQMRKEQMLQDARNRGIVVDDAYIASVDKIALGTAETARKLAATRLGADIGFERDQLGRTANEQAAYARARGQFGDTTSPEAQLAIAQSMDLGNLKETRTTFQDTASSLVSSLSRGGNAMQAFANAASRLGDKLINIAFDQIGGSLFGGAAKGGGGLGGLFGGLFGGGPKASSDLPIAPVNDASWFDPFAFATGGIMTSQGALPLHRYATGGIASSPQMAIFGEGRGPEAYVPLPDGRRIPVAMQGGAANSNSSGYTDARTISIDARGSTMTEEQIRGVVLQATAASAQEQYRTQAESRETYRRAAG
jgi:hypothetical protein